MQSGWIKKALLIITFTSFLTLANATNAFAGVHMTLTPQSGNLTSSLNVGVNLDTNGENVGTIEITLKPVNLDYVSSTEGNVGCDDTQILEAGENIIILCSFDSEGFAEADRLANLVFSTVSGSSSAQIQFLSVDVLEANEDSTPIEENTFINGNYTVGGGNGNGSGNGGNLPQTSFLSWKSAAFLIYILIFGTYIYSTVNKYYGTPQGRTRKDKTPLSQKI